MGLAYATSERGACHLRAFTIFAEDPFDIPSLTREVVDGQNLAAVKFSMCFCDFWGTVTPEIMADLLSTGLGKKIEAQDLVKSGERTWNLCRLFNLRAGFGTAHDSLPEKIMNQGLENGLHQGRTFGREDFEEARQAYYRLRGWNPDGTPARNKLEELDLEEL
jgi:aldehyde:ferredoxin oxidoreductase